ncbi:ATP-binding cassette domain-containing protein [Microbacterium sp. ZW T5_56]|uniref:ABC transporter ATP-binding protein n=1 Tax=Microbacterium sp. ZW T5_56 TaxID=3378081 RepID=UPI0038539393
MTNDAAETAEGVVSAEAAELPSSAHTSEDESMHTASEGERDAAASEQTVQDDEPGDDSGPRDEVSHDGSSSGHAETEGESLSESPASDDDAELTPDAESPHEAASSDDDATPDPSGIDDEAGIDDEVPTRDAGDQAEAEAEADDDDANTDTDADMNELLGIAPDPDDVALSDDGATDGGATDDERNGSEADAVSDESARDALSHPEAHLLAPLVGAPPRIRPAAITETSEPVDPATAVLVARGLVKDFGGTHAVDEIDLTVPTGSFYGIVGPNGAGKTTTLSMISGLLRPDRGTITVAGIDARQRARAAKKLIGVLPDRFRTFDRLTGRQLLHYYGLLRGLKSSVVDQRTADLARAFDLTDALGRAVSDYSAGMTKKVMLAGAMIHSPRLLVLDEPFEAVDPVSAAVILEILSQYVAGGGTVILSSHTMELVERVCSRVAVVVAGQVLAEGTVDEVRGDLTLEQRFVELSGGLTEVEGLEWLHTFSD